MTMSDRGLHPDLIDEEIAAREQQAEPQEAPAPRRSRGRRESAPTPEPTSAATSDADASPPGTEAEAAAPPEWFSQAREAFEKDPAEAFKLLAKNLPKEQLEQDETLSGLIGSRSDLRARQILQQQQRDAEERAKLEAAQNNDLYTLGELTQREYQERIAQQQAIQQAGPFMDGVVLFQQSLPEAIQREVAGKVFGEGKGQAQGVAEYLQYIAEARTRLEVDKEISRRESALRKSVLSEVNGDEPVPEREGGTPGRVREVTDEQIAAMSMREYDALFDEDGHPKPGVRHRATRSIPLTQR
jgi:hypothetical protein